MPETETIHREQALEQLRQHGIDGAEVYLIDIIPLIEMTWADGVVQIDEVLDFRFWILDFGFWKCAIINHQS